LMPGLILDRSRIGGFFPSLWPSIDSIDAQQPMALSLY
jgi:hypothetical protein